MEEEQAKRLPTISIGWDQETQSVHLKFENSEFRTWSFVKAIFAQAMDLADQKAKEGHVMAMQRMAMEHAQAESLRRRIQH
jgi:hypothetical protein